MAAHRSTLPTLLLAAVVGLAGLGLGGCGESVDYQLSDVALQAYDPLRRTLESGTASGDELRQLHEMTAEALGNALDRFPEADDRLKSVLGEIRDGEQRLADGEVRGADADALRERHNELWSYLERHELPPDYR